MYFYAHFLLGRQMAEPPRSAREKQLAKQTVRGVVGEPRALGGNKVFGRGGVQPRLLTAGMSLGGKLGAGDLCRGRALSGPWGGCGGSSGHDTKGISETMMMRRRRRRGQGPGVGDPVGKKRSQRKEEWREEKREGTERRGCLGGMFWIPDTGPSKTLKHLSTAPDSG